MARKLWNWIINRTENLYAKQNVYFKKRQILQFFAWKRVETLICHWVVTCWPKENVKIWPKISPKRLQSSFVWDSSLNNRSINFDSLSLKAKTNFCVTDRDDVWSQFLNLVWIRLPNNTVKISNKGLVILNFWEIVKMREFRIVSYSTYQKVASKGRFGQNLLF